MCPLAIPLTSFHIANSLAVSNIGGSRIFLMPRKMHCMFFILAIFSIANAAPQNSQTSKTPLNQAPARGWWPPNPEFRCRKIEEGILIPLCCWKIRGRLDCYQCKSLMHRTVSIELLSHFGEAPDGTVD